MMEFPWGLGLTCLLATSVAWSQAPDETACFDVPRVEGIQVDGDHADWGQGGFRVDLLMEHNGERVLPPNDFDPRFRLGWDDRGLLVLALIRDDKVQETEKAEELGNRDALELFVARQRGQREYYQVAIGTGADPAHPAVRTHLWDYRQSKEKLPALQVQAAGRAAPGGYQVEVLLPWENLGLQPKAGDEAAFQFWITDSDAPDDWFRAAWYPEGWTFTHPAAMHRIRLSANAPSPPVMAAMRSRFINLEQYLVRVVATAMGDGRPVTLREGDRQLARGTLRPENGRPTARLVAPAPYTQVQADRRILVCLDDQELGRTAIGRLRNLTYRSEVDDSEQGYVLYLPRTLGLEEGKKHPLCVFGVGYGSRAGPPPAQAWADEHGWLLLSFDGRQSLHYNGLAETDLDQLLHRELAARLPIDLARVYFIGGSQGASGAFGMGFRHPDWFSSVAGSGGFVDVHEWYPRWHDQPDEGRWGRQYSGPRWRWPAALAYSAVDSAEHAYWMNPFIHVGERDETNRQWALRKLSARLSELGISHVYVETPAGGHVAGFDRTAALEHFRLHSQPVDPLRPRVWISTNRLEHARVGWAEIDSLFNREQPAKLLAVLDRPGRLRLTLSPQVRSFGLELSPELLAHNGIGPEVRLKVEGDAGSLELEPLRGPLRLTMHRESPQGPWKRLPAGTRGLRAKRPGLEGPVNHVFQTPFTIVYGAAGTLVQTERNRRAAFSLAEQYASLMKAVVTPVSEKDLTDEQRTSRSLVLVGCDRDCVLLRQCAQDVADWPYETGLDRVGVRNLELFPVESHALFGVFPSPWAAQRYVAVLSGFENIPFLGLGWRASFWLPDFVIFRKTQEQLPEAELYALAGSFNEDWRLDLDNK